MVYRYQRFLRTRPHFQDTTLNINAANFTETLLSIYISKTCASFMAHNYLTTQQISQYLVSFDFSDLWRMCCSWWQRHEAGSNQDGVLNMTACVLVKIFEQTTSVIRIQREYRMEFESKKAPRMSAIYRLVNKSETTGNVCIIRRVFSVTSNLSEH